MTTPFKTAIAALAVSAFITAPVVIGTSVLGASAAYAKSENASGGKSNAGNGGGKSNAGKSGNKSTKLTTRGKSSTKSQKGGKPLKDLFSRKSGSGNGKLLDIFKPKSKRTAGKTTRSAKAKPNEFGLHPHDLGKLNGALNSSPNAKLAHIRNGNFNGPVGLAAALAVADYQAGEIDTASIEAAQAILDYDQALHDGALADALFASPDFTDDVEFQAALDLAAFDLGYADYDAYRAENTDPLVDAELEALLDNTIPPSEDDVIAATATLEQASSVKDAEMALLDAWNKGDADDPNAGLVLEAIRTSLPNDEQIAEALGETETDTELLEPTPEEIADLEDEATVPVLIVE